MRHLKDGPLYDAARMLRLAAARCERIADEDATAHLGNSEAVSKRRHKLAGEALSNLDAAQARILPYRRGGGR